MSGVRTGCLRVAAWAGLAVAAVGVGLFLWLREPPPDTRFTGAYSTSEGELVVVVPSSGGELRLERPMRGERRPLQPAGDGSYRVGTAGTPAPPERQRELVATFEVGADGPEAVRLADADGEAVLEAGAMDLPEERFRFTSDGHALRAKLVLPPASRGPGPHPAAVVVHGSGKESAVDGYDEPYVFAPHGVATLVYDKRGTGGSEGTYTQNFHVLARDVIAAVEALRGRPEIDPARIHLVGYSQGGWIAPLAAVRDGGIRSVVVGYGPMVPIVDEDRWGYVYTLRKKGFGEEAIARADRIHDLVVRIVDHGETGRWGELGRALEEAEDEEWFRAAATSDSTIGFLSANRWVPLWAIRLYARWMLRPIDGEPRADRLYDPVPVVARLEAPSLWVFGGDDHSMPTEWTVEELERLRARGAPIEIVVYPRADHGITLYEETADGSRRFIGYEPDYQRTVVEWLQRHSGIGPHAR